MSERIIFLDVDGVLNSDAWFRSEEYKKRRYELHQDEHFVKRSLGQESTEEQKDAYAVMLKATHIDPKSLAHLNTALKITNAKIVVSSTWRVAPWTLKALAESGIDTWAERFLGVTRRSRGEECRGDEIKDWVKDNNFKGQFIMLDDDSDAGPVKEHLIQTNYLYGFTGETMNQVCAYFNA